MSDVYFRDHRGDSCYVASDFDSDEDLRVFGTFISRVEVRRLRDHLTAVLGDTPTPAPAAPLEIVVGREYRLLPGARRANGYRDAFERQGVTLVELVAPVDEDGDVEVRSLDGTNPRDVAYVLPRYLAPLDPQPAAPDAVKAAREVAAEMRTGGLYVQARAFEMFAAKLEGKSE